jgi:hypothetical protein
MRAFGADLTNVIFAHNKIQHIFRVLYDQSLTPNENRRNFPLDESLITELDKILSQIKT